MVRKTETLGVIERFLVLLVAVLGLIVAVGGCSGGDEPEPEKQVEQRTGASVPIRLNEVMFVAPPGGEWVELFNPAANAVNIGGFDITHEGSTLYKIPESLPPMPAGGFVLILFDGQGTAAQTAQNGNNFVDGRVVLHAGSTSDDVFNNTSDTCSLYVGESRELDALVDFVSWGDYPQEGHYVNNQEELGSNGPVGEQESIGVHPDVYMISARLNWAIYAENETTSGERNAVPAPIPTIPLQASAIEADNIYFVWDDASLSSEAFLLEVDNDNDFSSPELSTRTTSNVHETGGPLASGKQFWRVKTLTSYQEESLWSAVASFSVVSQSRSPLVGQWDLGIKPVLVQRKDTWLLCPACAEFGDHSWDAPHSDDITGVHKCNHCKVYCSRASLTMLNRYFGGDVSEDFVSWLMNAGGQYPAETLGHGKGASGDDVTTTIELLFHEAPIVNHEGISFPKVIHYINQGRPLLTASKGHAMVIDGYSDYEDPADDRYHLLDPWTGKETLMSPIKPGCPLLAIWPLPAGLHGISEGLLMLDTDKDGVTDHDEEHRFGSSPITDDSDGDLIPDWIEIWAWAYGKGSQPRRPVNGWKIWLKKNYDGDAYDDGHEDLNRNGKLDPGECDPFVKDQPVLIFAEIGGADGGGVPVDINAVPVGEFGSTGKVPGYFEKEVPFLWCGTLEQGSTNRITITARTSRGYDHSDASGRSDALDDVMVKQIVIVDTQDNKVLLRAPGPYHLGNDTLAEIKKSIEDGEWYDPNGLAFWTELDGTSISLTFAWH